MNESEKASLIATFYTALLDCFRDEDDRRLDACVPVDFERINCNEIILCMLRAFQIIVTEITDFDGDPLEFLALLTRLLFLDNIKEENIESGDDENEN